MVDQLDEATKKKIADHYMKGEGSIQAIAREYRVTVETVLEITGNSDLSSVYAVGDQIDQEDAGNATLNGPQRFRVPYDPS